MVNKKEISSYEIDASRLVGTAVKVAFPKTVKEVQNLIKTSEIDIVPRGAGTNLVGGCIPNNSLVIDLNKMDRVINFDPKGTVYVEAGVSLKELNEKLSAVGFEFPIQPLNEGVSTIGGMIATNASNSKEIKYGRIKDWIEYIEFVNGRGELMKTTKTDLMDVCGMEGITGIIVGVKLRIIPRIKRTASIFQTDNIEEILSISRRLKLEKDICSLDLFSKEVSKILGFPEKYNLIVEFDSDRGKIKDNEYTQIKKLKDKVYYALIKEEYINSEDPKLFFDKLKEFILYLESNQIPYFSHLGAGVVIPFFKDNENEKRKDVKDMMKQMGAKLGKYGKGITRKDFIDNFEMKIIQRVKLRNDPFGKLNKGKIINFDRKIPKMHDRELLTKPTVIEETSTAKITTPLKEIETTSPEQKMEEFIEEVKTLEEKEPEIKEQILDYEQTYDSELEKEKRKKIEKIAKEVASSIIHKTKIQPPLEIEKPKHSLQDFNASPRGKVSAEEQDMINSVLGNRVKSKEEKNDN